MLLTPKSLMEKKGEIVEPLSCFKLFLRLRGF